jgi:hypothetical protein
LAKAVNYVDHLPPVARDPVGDPNVNQAVLAAKMIGRGAVRAAPEVGRMFGEIVAAVVIFLFCIAWLLILMTIYGHAGPTWGNGAVLATSAVAVLAILNVIRKTLQEILVELRRSNGDE